VTPATAPQPYHQRVNARQIIIKIKFNQKEPIRAMQTTKPTAQTPTAAEPVVLQKRIDSTTYVVNIRFCENAKETLGQKLLRLIESEVGKSA
jgi:cell fate (sporulation/competence/biofilm development) regulator YmcA (YheA/YmcA/DUF963 family)